MKTERKETAIEMTRIDEFEGQREEKPVPIRSLETDSDTVLLSNTICYERIAIYG